MKPTLYVFSGLPGTGKTTIAKEAAKRIKVAYFRIDTIEHGLKEVCSINVQGEGYRLTYRLVADNLRIGNDVIVDCTNPWELTRNEWADVALESKSSIIDIEILCTDKGEHKARVENRENDILGFNLPSWEEVQKRDYHEWKKERIVIETSNRQLAECVDELMKKLEVERGRLT